MTGVVAAVESETTNGSFTDWVADSVTELLAMEIAGKETVLPSAAPFNR